VRTLQGLVNDVLRISWQVLAEFRALPTSTKGKCILKSDTWIKADSRCAAWSRADQGGRFATMFVKIDCPGARSENRPMSQPHEDLANPTEGTSLPGI
jgi:hypothetical protein